MKIATFVSFAAVAAALLAQPAWASDDSATVSASTAAPAATFANHAPESPAAAFERLFASRPAKSLPRVATRPDAAFERHFQAALWSAETPTLTLAVRAGELTDGVRP